jgi:hypothetical protein
MSLMLAGVLNYCDYWLCSYLRVPLCNSHPAAAALSSISSTSPPQPPLCPRLSPNTQPSTRRQHQILPSANIRSLFYRALEPCSSFSSIQPFNLLTPTSLVLLSLVLFLFVHPTSCRHLSSSRLLELICSRLALLSV